MTRRAWILMAILAALWGSSYMFIKISLDGGLSDTFIVFGRTALGALVLAPVALSRGVFAAARRRIGWLVLIAGVQIIGPFLLITVGEHHVSSSLAGILVASAPIFTAIIAVAAVQSERLSGIGLVGIAIGIVGVALLFGVDLAGSSSTLLAGLGILLASLGYAVGALIAKFKLADVPPIGVAASIMGLSALFLVPTVPFGGPSTAPDLGTIGAMLVLGAGGTGIAFLIYYTLNAEIGPGRASVVAYIAPVFSVLYGVTLLDESFTAGTAAGVVLILVGSWMAADGRIPRRRQPKRTLPLERARAWARST
jgi:drug/metabolite transporter (DMT)-like permease